MSLYTEVAQKLQTLIEDGTLKPGDQVPSIRVLSQRFQVSTNTVKEAYALLETQRVIEAKPQSGYYVRRRPLPEIRSLKLQDPSRLDPTQVSLCRVFGEVNRRGEVPGSTLAISLPDSQLLPGKKLNEALQGAWKTLGRDMLGYQMAPGLPLLREQIALRMTDAGCLVNPDDIIITTGCSEAVYLALFSLCSPGDTIAVETPIYFNFLHLLFELKIQVLEIPSTPQEGMNLQVLEFALRNHAIKAVLSIPNFSNPLGSLMPEEKKQALVALCQEHQVPLIEDDIYGDLGAAGARPRAAKAYDTGGNVLYCSSFSKTLAPGYRIGWIIPGKFQEKVDKLKSLFTVATPTPNQWAIGKFLETGGYDRHIRHLRQALAQQVGAMSETVARSFPEGTRISRPAGGLVLWIQLPEDLDALDLYEEALPQGILISPGVLFSASGAFQNCMRLSAGVWNPEVEASVEKLGAMARNLGLRTRIPKVQ